MENLVHETRRKSIVISIAVVAALLILPIANVPAALSAPLASTITVPTLVGFEGYLTDGTGQPISDGAHLLAFRVYSSTTDLPNNALWVETQTVTVTTGLYSSLLGISQTLTATMFSGNRWIGVTVDGGIEITPRTRVASVPFALNAEHANSAESVDWAGVANKPVNLVTGSGAIGQLTLWSGTNTVTSTSGLTYSGNNLSVSGGLNIGTATGAAAGQVKINDVFISTQGTTNTAGVNISRGTTTMQLFSNVGAGGFGGLSQAGDVAMLAVGPSPNSAALVLSVWGTGSPGIRIGTDGNTTIGGGLNVGTATGATTGQIKANGTISTTGGIDVGTATGAAAGQIKASGAISTTSGINVGTASGATAGEVRASAFASQQLPFTTYAVLPSSITVNAVVFMVTIYAAGTVIEWDQTWSVATTNNGTNFWTIRMKRLDTGAIISSFDTSAVVANIWTRKANTAINFAITTGMQGLYIDATKTGSPGNLSLPGPAVFAQ